MESRKPSSELDSLDPSLRWDDKIKNTDRCMRSVFLLFRYVKGQGTRSDVVPLSSDNSKPLHGNNVAVPHVKLNSLRSDNNFPRRNGIGEVDKKITANIELVVITGLLICLLSRSNHLRF